MVSDVFGTSVRLLGLLDAPLLGKGAATGVELNIGLKWHITHGLKH